MPKGKNKGKKRGRQEVRPPGVSPAMMDDDEDTGDAMSISSSQSDVKSAEGDEEVDETSAQEELEDKLKGYIDGLTQKSAKGRIDCMKGISMALQKKYLFDFLVERKLTVTDALERCLKKGGGEELAGAAGCLGLVIITLGSCEDSEEIFKDVRPLLMTLLADNSKSPKGRSACAETLAMGSFIASEEYEDILSVMKSLENVFKGSYLKGDGSTPSHSPDIAALHSSALSAWTLLLSIAHPSTIDNIVESHLSRLPGLLTSSDVDVRIAAGETIALIYELVRSSDEDFEGDNMAELCETLKQLATDSNKFRAKKDRRQQRANFRDILKAVEECEAPECRIKFATECLYIESWIAKRQYDAFCHMLGSGTNAHLQENEIIRDIFSLGAPIPITAIPISRGSKAERHHLNAAAFKARTKARAKNRDKRAVTYSS